ncbi:MAG: hypothetical protein ACOYUZ_03555 [Patescibacteria group bacterium]
MQKSKPRTHEGNFLPRRFFKTAAVLIVFALMLVSFKAKAERSCISHVQIFEEKVIVYHNPECDLRILPRMFPQIDPETEKPYPMQIQLRSIWAANQTRVVDGEKIRFTVMRGCARPGKPSDHADEEEMKECPDGLMNYFSAPSSDSMARIEIPKKRKLTLAEAALATAKTVCATLQSRELKPEEGDALKKCQDLIPGFSAVMAKATTAPTESDKVDSEQVAFLKNENAQLKTQLAAITPPNDRGGLIGVLFFGIVALCAYGAGSTIWLIRERRSRQDIEYRHKQYKLGADSERKSQFEMVRRSAQQEIWEKENGVIEQAQATLREKFEKEYRAKLDERDVRIRKLEAKLGELEKAQTVEVPLQNQNADLRNVNAALQAQNVELNQQIADIYRERDQAADERKKAVSERNSAQAEVNGAMVQVRELEGLLNTLRKEKSTISNELNEMRFQIVPKLQASLAQESQISSELRKRIDFLEAGIAAMQSQRPADDSVMDQRRQLRRTLQYGDVQSLIESTENNEQSAENDTAEQSAAEIKSGHYAYVDPGRQAAAQSAVNDEALKTAIIAGEQATDSDYPREWDEKTPVISIEEMQARAMESTRPQAMPPRPVAQGINLESDPDDLDQETAVSPPGDSLQNGLMFLFETMLAARKNILQRLENTIMQTRGILDQLNHAVQEDPKGKNVKTFRSRAIEVDRLLARLKDEQLPEANEAVDRLSSLQVYPMPKRMRVFVECLAQEQESAHKQRSRLLEIRTILDSVTEAMSQQERLGTGQLDAIKVNAWNDLVLNLSGVLNVVLPDESSMKNEDWVNAASNQLTTKVFEIIGEFSQRQGELMRVKNEFAALESKLDESEKQRRALRQSLAEADQSCRVLQDRLEIKEEENSRLRNVVNQDKPLSVLADYEGRTLEAERTALDAKREVRRLENELRAERVANEISAYGIRNTKELAGIFARPLLNCETNALIQGSLQIMLAVSEKMAGGERFEFPLASDADMHALYSFLQIPVIGVGYHKLPKLNLGKNELLKIKHFGDDVCAPPGKLDISQIRRMTQPPPAVVKGVPEGRSSVPPQDDSHEIASGTRSAVQDQSGAGVDGKQASK